MFNQPTVIKDIAGREYREVLRPGCFDRSLKERTDLRLLRDHQPQLLLGRTKSGTLEVGTDDYGLWFRADLPDTQEGRDVAESIKRGDLDSCSFGFEVKADNWINGDDMRTRELLDLTLYECSIVAFPAYETGTSVDLRSIERRKAMTETTKLRLRLARYKHTIGGK